MAKIIHRDLKFENVMLNEKPRYFENGKLDINSVEIKVVDFGIFGSIAGVRKESVTFGSLKYMAPELIKGDMRSTPAIDVWSLGLMLHGLIFGHLPFQERLMSKLKEQITE